MTNDDQRAPGNRIRPGLIVAIAVAVLMAVGIGGLIAAALLGDDSDPMGVGLSPTVNVDEPATAASAIGGGGTASVDRPEASGTESSSGSDASEPAGDSEFNPDSPTTTPPPTVSTAVAVNELEEPTQDELPAPGGDPVVLPTMVPHAAPPSTFEAIPFDELAPGAIPGLEDWSVAERTGDRVSFSDGDRVIEIFVIDDAVSADDALEQFYDDVQPDLEELNRSPISRLGAPSARFVSVAGSEYVATSSGQQGTTVMTGAIIAGARTDGTAVVITSSRSGTSSADELAQDAELLRAVLARL